MSIPRVIHFCWFGRVPKPELVCRCIDSWKKYCPDYQYIDWNEDNVSIEKCPKYVQDAYASGLYAFVSDYVRLKVVYEYGGVYLDTDVQLIKSLDHLLEHRGFFGFENKMSIDTGLGFGTEKGEKILQELMNDYEKLSFQNADGTVNYATCTEINTHVFVEHGLQLNNKMQSIDNDILILPTEYLCPIEYETDIMHKTFRTISIHWFAKSWMTRESILAHKQRRWKVILDRFVHLPNRVLLKTLGKSKYEALKRIVKG